MTLILWGDSLTQAGGIAGELSRMSGEHIVNAGVGGETSRLIVARMGALPLEFHRGSRTRDDGAVEVLPVGGWPLLQGSGNPLDPGAWWGELGGAHGRLSLQKSDPTSPTHHDEDRYWFESEADVVGGMFLPELAWVPAEARHIVWMGQNDEDPTVTMRHFEAAVRYLGDGVVALMSGTGAKHVGETALERELSNRFGNKFLNVRRFLIDEAPMLAGIDDEHESDGVPAGLRTDNVHHTLEAQRLVARHLLAPRL